MEHSREVFKNVMMIHTPKEFSFAENLNYLQRSPNECLFTIVDEKIYRAIRVGSETTLVKISAEE